MNPALPAKPASKENETLHFPTKIYNMPTPREKLAKLESERQALVAEVVAELRQKISDTKALLRADEEELARYTGHAPSPSGRAPRVSPEEIVAGALKFLSGKKEGARSNEIATAIGVDSKQISPVLSKDSKFKSTGKKGGTRYMLK